MGQAMQRPKAGRATRLLVGLVSAAAVLTLEAWATAYFTTHPPRRRARQAAARGLPVENVAFPSRDGVRLAGWFIPARDADTVVVVCHGYLCNRADMLPWARELHAAGHSVLLFDFRGSGESGPALCSMGHHEVGDLQGALDYLETRPDTRNARVGVMGLSMGGATALMTAARDQRIRAVATHGAFASLERPLRRRCSSMVGPAWPVLRWLTIAIGRRWMPVEPAQIAPVETIRAIAPRPVLLAQGDWDLIVWPEDGRILKRAAGTNAQLIRLRRSWHMGVASREWDRYAARLRLFFAEALRSD